MDVAVFGKKFFNLPDWSSPPELSEFTGIDAWLSSKPFSSGTLTSCSGLNGRSFSFSSGSSGGSPGSVFGGVSGGFIGVST